MEALAEAANPPYGGLGVVLVLEQVNNARVSGAAIVSTFKTYGLVSNF